MKRIFLLVPSFHPTGPVKGAIALANAVAGERDVFLVALKGGPGADTPIDSRVNVISFGRNESWISRSSRYRKLLQDSGGRSRVASISFCFSADIFNLTNRRSALICSSVRGNLPENYRMDYGVAGTLLAYVHLASLRYFDRVAVMTEAMASQVAFHGKCHPCIIGNFIDEAPLEPYRRESRHTGPLRFVFLASLSSRKCPLLLLRALNSLRRERTDIHLDIIGDGPLRSALESEIGRLNLDDIVTMHGHLSVPYPILSQADVLVLPSLSEGVSRAVLESLYLGIPCILRSADGSGELIQPGMNGALFERDADLARVMLDTALWSRQLPVTGRVLLPDTFRQRRGSLSYLAMVENEP